MNFLHKIVAYLLALGCFEESRAEKVNCDIVWESQVGNWVSGVVSWESGVMNQKSCFVQVYVFAV